LPKTAEFCKKANNQEKPYLLLDRTAYDVLSSWIAYAANPLF
jgi:hypothetical protein